MLDARRLGFWHLGPAPAPQRGIGIEGRTYPPGAEPFAWKRVASPGYFEALRTPVLTGRVFDERDAGRRAAGGLVASLVPALRATHLDPASVLRSE